VVYILQSTYLAPVRRLDFGWWVKLTQYGTFQHTVETFNALNSSRKKWQATRRTYIALIVILDRWKSVRWPFGGVNTDLGNFPGSARTSTLGGY
jgi:hypothetical protein